MLIKSFNSILISSQNSYNAKRTPLSSHLEKRPLKYILIELNLCLILIYASSCSKKHYRLQIRCKSVAKSNFKSFKPLILLDYSMIVATRPEPTVRPPSLIANVRPCSIAIGWISSIVISMLSPGIHISVPAGKLQTPVTSVVLK